MSTALWRLGRRALRSYGVHAIYQLTCFISAHEEAQQEAHWMLDRAEVEGRCGHGEDQGRCRVHRLRGQVLQEQQHGLRGHSRFRRTMSAGRGLGRGLGWPTANLQVDGRKFLPGLGRFSLECL